MKKASQRKKLRTADRDASTREGKRETEPTNDEETVRGKSLRKMVGSTWG